MEVLHARCAGLDVHKKQVKACVRVAEGSRVKRDVREYRTTTADLLRLGEWLESEGVTHVAMEATGPYWKPVWHVLEDGFELVLANAHEVKSVPGRTSDVSDAAWLAAGLRRPEYPLPAGRRRVPGAGSPTPPAVLDGAPPAL